MKYTVQELIDKLNKVEDKNKIVFIEGLSNFGSYYDVSGYDVIIEEDDGSLTLQIDKYNW